MILLIFQIHLTNLLAFISLDFLKSFNRVD